jgi:hypothetical protein
MVWKWIRFVFLTIAVVVVPAISFSVWNSTQDVIATATAGAGASAFFAAVYAALALESMETSADHLKKKFATELIGKWASREMGDVARRVGEFREECMGLSPKEISERISADSRLKTDVIVVFNFLEKLSICVQKGVADEGVLTEFFRPIVLNYWSCFSEWVSELRRRSRSDQIFTGVEALATRWKQ